LDSRLKVSRFRKNFFNLTSLDSRFKIQGSENFFNPTSLDSRFKIQGPEKLLQSNLFRFKIQDSSLKAFGFKKLFLDLES
jgi:hypothetical protein